MMEYVGAVLQEKMGVLSIGERICVLDRHVELVANCFERAIEKGIGGNSVDRRADDGSQGEASICWLGIAACQDRDASWYQNGPHDLSLGCIPQPITKLFMKSIVLAQRIGRHRVAESIEPLCMIVDGADGFEDRTFSVGGFHETE